MFIFGLPRSGTTLVEQVLASHSQVHGAGELLLAHQTFASIPELLGRGSASLDGLAQLDASALRLLAGRHLERLRAIAGGRSLRIVDKMPENDLHLGLLAAMFPRATFIHCRRSPRRRPVLLDDRFCRYPLVQRFWTYSLRAFDSTSA